MWSAVRSAPASSEARASSAATSVRSPSSSSILAEIAASGSSRSVFVGVSATDWARLLPARGLGAVTAYTASGASLAVAANRLSYFYDVHGPSWAIDTAFCASLSSRSISP